MLSAYFTTDFDGDLGRLSRFRPDAAREVLRIVWEELCVDGEVGAVYDPHVLGNSGGFYNGCVEFHVADDVLVLYSPPKPRDKITLRRICTHEELRSGRFGVDWPQG